MNIADLVKLTTRAWSLDILALMSDGVPGRQAQLLAASGASRNAFQQSLDHLVTLGLVERNPGHGHPLRPEFRLTPKGQAIGPKAVKVRRLVPDADAARLLRRTWTLPVLAASQTPRHFGALRDTLGPITDRALVQSLRQLQDIEWIDRRIDPASTRVRPLYQAVQTGQLLGQAVHRAA